MSSPIFTIWKRLPFSSIEMRCQVTLLNGQAFNWNKNNNIYTGVLYDRLIVFKEEENYIDYKFTPTNNNDIFIDKCILYYLHSNIDIITLHKQWSDSDDWLKNVLHSIKGMRLLRQNPHECLFSFLCSSNNNIGRISKMLHALRSNYGAEICEYEGVKYFTFPTLKQMQAIKESDLRELGFGYRAKFITGTIELLSKFNESWFDDIKCLPTGKTILELQKMPGIGPKVADCIALFSLDKFEIVPVDVHVWKLTQKHYAKHFPSFKTLNPKMYSLINSFYRNKFGDYCGWAHSILFTADLSTFSKQVHNFKTEEQKSDQILLLNNEINNQDIKPVNKKRKKNTNK